ncbi:MAG: hypothetical protein EXR79_06875 [Myxococcales bacterium]|nr:hypothetical protein [Myxococcales bacterium]
MTRTPLVARFTGTLLAALFTGALCAPGSAQAATLATQGILRSAQGGPVADGNYLLVVTLYDAADAQKPLHEELHKTVEVQGGLFALQFGSIKPIPDDLLAAGTALWVGVSVGSDPELPRAKLVAVARAWYAANAGAGSFPYAASDKPGGAATGLQCTGCVGGAHIAAGAIDAKHVAFTYAGSASKGGPADLALVAKTADQAKVADSALQAKVAENALSAAKADDLACKGCITYGHLHPDVPKSLLSVAGGTLTGPLVASKGVDLQGSVLAGAQFAEVDIAKTACDAGHKGMLATTAAGALYFCLGTQWKKVALCGGDCKLAGAVACSLPITDECGEVGSCSGTGSYCDGSKVCAANGCVGPGESAATALASCAALKKLAATLPDGTYWINPTGAVGGAFQAWCDMTTNGGGWTRCLAHRYLPTLPASFKKTWVSTVWSTGGKYAFADSADGTDYGNFCTLLAAQSTQFYGRARYPVGFATNFATTTLALPANFFDAGSQVIAKGNGNHAIAKDNGTNGQGHFEIGCTTSYSANKMQGIHALCLSDGAKYQAQHTGWTDGQHPGSCPDSSSQACTCSQSQYCGGSNALEKGIVMTLYLR